MMRSLLHLHRQANLPGLKPLGARLLIVFLIPFSYFYSLVVRARNAAYDCKLLPVYQASVPVISVGNLAVGGTGKTPAVDWLIKQLQQQGKRPAVVSRGYGGNYSESVGVVSDGHAILMSAHQCGDEPLLLARRNPVAPVVVARRRADGIKYLEQSGCIDVIVLDDGFQHRSVARTLNLVLLDADNPFGNGWTLPAGNLREGKSALRRADILLITRSQDESSFNFADKPVFFSQHRLADVACDVQGVTTNLIQLSPMKVAAFAGIADPESFFSGLRRQGVQPTETIALPDHVTYTSDVVRQINYLAKGCQLLLTTEKDGIKLEKQMFSLPCYTVGLDFQISNQEQLMTTIHQKIWSNS